MDTRLSGAAFSDLNERIISLLDSFSALSTLSSLNIRHPDIETMLRRALKGLMENVDMERCSIFLLQGERLVNCVGLDWDAMLSEENDVFRFSPCDNLEASIGEGIMGLAVQTGTLQHCRDCSIDPRFKIAGGPPIGSLISVPIFQIGGEVLGVLNVSHSRPDFFNEWHERLLLVWCNCLGQLIAGNRLVTQMDREIDKRTVQLKHALAEAQSAERDLRASEKRLKLVLEGSSDGFWDWSLVRGEVKLSPRWAEILGYTLHEVEQAFRDGKDLVNPEDALSVRTVLMRHLQGSIPQYAVEFRVMSRSGEWKWVLDRGKVVEWDEKGRPLRMTGTTTDVTDRRRAEEEKRHLEYQLNHSQKLEAIGQLAGGVAHEFNNIMTAIIGFGHLLVMKTEENSQLRHFSNQILTSAERASVVTRSLLTFSRKHVLYPHHVNVNETIEKIGTLLSRLIREDIEFRTDIGRERLVVLADEGQLEQVLVNLVTNARDAMPKGGVVTVSTGVAELAGEYVRSYGYGQPGLFARISIIDTGIGMDATIREKIFEPFFTTKEPGKGTGLGLAIVYGIIKQHNGYIEVSSAPGEGSDFTLYLPLAEGVETARETVPPSDLRTGTETILIAEDDDDVRMLHRDLLEECGYTVLEAANGSDACAVFLENRERIDLLIFDVIMPKMNGREAHEEIRKVRPDIRALFTSGYTGDILGGAAGIDPQFDFIAKPITPDEFLRKVRDVLEREP
ncbi:MAG TPA: ATP-binding protein [Geobacteraceae bacterium]|nr:ATP-binding protein [Geobacteraceae bacterium]